MTVYNGQAELYEPNYHQGQHHRNIRNTRFDSRITLNGLEPDGKVVDQKEEI